MLKKITLLAMAVGALVVFAVPASASASDVWTDWNGAEHATLGEGVTANQSFEGFLQFTAGAAGTFGCNVTVEVEAEGPAGGRITKFNPTTSSCVGTGPGFSGCVLKEDFNNIATAGWNIDVSTTPATVTAGSGNLTIRNVYSGCLSGNPGSHLEFASINVTPTLNGEGTITALTISGSSTVGVPAEGTVTPEGDLTLGIEAL